MVLILGSITLITAAYILATTNEFISITEAKKFACYCGVAPFEHTSGIRIKGKSRVSHKANKEVKTLFHMAALSSVRIKGDLQNYFHRKVAEGKNKMSVLNAIRNKLILRVFSCVNRNSIFQKNYKYNFAEP
ncbi:IS110 family transposase [Dyadobacter flavalbus]|uniref:IS110 family transposase n=1 Tax=Dyadobacter flavalbus TaxID=2579942 RepID=A0A5M8QXT4_9BACT|nr:transposase [Dyadobacter flavalbus]KAA6438822.1 IS110 family transposase [Dyadobacter flavalbus]